MSGNDQWENKDVEYETQKHQNPNKPKSENMQIEIESVAPEDVEQPKKGWFKKALYVGAIGTALVVAPIVSYFKGAKTGKTEAEQVYQGKTASAAYDPSIARENAELKEKLNSLEKQVKENSKFKEKINQYEVQISEYQEEKVKYTKEAEQKIKDLQTAQEEKDKLKAQEELKKIQEARKEAENKVKALEEAKRSELHGQIVKYQEDLANAQQKNGEYQKASAAEIARITREKQAKINELEARLKDAEPKTATEKNMQNLFNNISKVVGEYQKTTRKIDSEHGQNMNDRNAESERIWKYRLAHGGSLEGYIPGDVKVEEDTTESKTETISVITEEGQEAIKVENEADIDSEEDEEIVPVIIK